MDDLTVAHAPALSVKQALERIIRFAQRFGSLHADLAAHAAFPVVLTPDLLYRLWASFLPHIPWTTVSDILLSPLCREVGYEMYEMDPAIRNILLRELREDPRYGEPRLRELAQFLEEYIRLHWRSEDPEQRELAEAQHWTALAHTAPEEVAREIAARISNPSQLEGSELLRVATLTETLSKQLQEYTPLVNYARGVERLAHGDPQAATALLDRVFEEKQDVEIAGVTLQRPRPAPDVQPAAVEGESRGAQGGLKIFLSYRRTDSEPIVGRIREKLVTAFGEENVFSEDEILPGMEFRAVLQREIERCNVMLVIIGPGWAKIRDTQGNRRLFDPLDFIRWEVEATLSRPEVLVIPVAVKHATLPRPTDLPESLRDLLRRNVIQIGNDPYFESDIQKLLRDIRGIVEEPPISVQDFEPETIPIPAGPFQMGSPPGKGVAYYETPQHELDLPAYRIGKYPITNAQYGEFVRETGKTVEPPGWRKQGVPEGMESHPVMGVSWYEALEYCQWLSEKTGRRYTLPNEAQWEKACRGRDNSTYPWGDTFDGTRCNAGHDRVAPVDRYPPQNNYGGFDFVGNIRQWTCTLWGESESNPDARYTYPWRDDERNDLNASRQVRRVLRGSSLLDDSRLAYCSFRSAQLPDERDVDGVACGFRVVVIETLPQDVTVDKQVFISYAWGGEREKIVNQIDQALRQRGIKVIRDKRELGDTGSISEFMERIGRGHCVIVVISDKYLRSPTSMLELVEIADRKQFYDRIFPIVLSDANIYNPTDRLEYVKYWEAKRGELEEALRTLDTANLQGIREDMDLYDRIRDLISGLASTLKDMNTLTPDMHKDSDFSELYAAIENRLNQGIAEEPRPQKQAPAATPAAEPAEQKAKIFLSFGRTDQNLAEFLAERLSDRGHIVFTGVDFIKSGENWAERTWQELESSDFVVVLLSETSVKSQYVQSEIQRAFDYKIRNGKPQFIPVRIAQAELPSFLQTFTHLIWRNERDNERLVQELVQAIQQPPQSGLEEQGSQSDAGTQNTQPTGIRNLTSDEWELLTRGQMDQSSLPYQVVSDIKHPYREVRLEAVQQLSELLLSKNLGLARSAREALELMVKEDKSRLVVQKASQALEAVGQAEQNQRTSLIETQTGIAESESQQASELLRRLGSEFYIDITEDWGERGGIWNPGTWTLAELERLYRAVTLMSDLMSGNVTFMGTFIRDRDGLGVERSDAGTHGRQVYRLTISLPKKGPLSVWTIVHEFAHQWDGNYEGQPSRELERFTGGSTNPLRSISARVLGNWDAGTYGPENKPGRYGRLPGCNRAGYFYGDKPSGSNWNFNRKEDFAESVAMYMGWGRDNELSQQAHDRIIRYTLPNGERDPFGVVDNWADYAKYFYPEDGDYTRTKRWQFMDELFKGKSSVARAS